MHLRRCAIALIIAFWLCAPVPAADEKPAAPQDKAAAPAKETKDAPAKDASAKDASAKDASAKDAPTTKEEPSKDAKDKPAEKPQEKPPAPEIFPDPQLKEVIKAILKQKQIDKKEIDPEDLKSIYFLDARGKGIKSLAGLERCPHLAEVKLSRNDITDLKPLAGLVNIQSLYLSQNKISDLKSLSALVKLQYLEAEQNQIKSIEGLEKLENLRALYIAGNQISDLAPLVNCRKLTSLDLNDNQVQKLDPIKELPWISTLGLKNNKVSELSPIAGYTELHYTFLQGLPLTDLSVLVEMAKKDVAGPKRFAPFWFLYLDVEKLPELARKQVEELKQLGVRINQK